MGLWLAVISFIQPKKKKKKGRKEILIHLEPHHSSPFLFQLSCFFLGGLLRDTTFFFKHLSGLTEPRIDQILENGSIPVQKGEKRARKKDEKLANHISSKKKEKKTKMKEKSIQRTLLSVCENHGPLSKENPESKQATNTQRSFFFPKYLDSVKPHRDNKSRVSMTEFLSHQNPTKKNSRKVDRTPDLQIFSLTLSQLSYSGIWN